jgi:hypothetical protein
VVKNSGPPTGSGLRCCPSARSRSTIGRKSELGWDFEVADGAFRDPAGRLGLVFGVTPVKILSFGKSPYSQTRYRFTA